MNFDIEEQSEENGSSNNNNNSMFMWIIIITVSLVCGVTVFLITNALFGKEVQTTPVVEEALPLTDENVQILYKYVTYGTGGKRNDKFLKESVVTLESFNNQEKFYYALQFAKKSDFQPTGEKNSKGEIIYNISEATIREYMQRFFGEKVAYSSKVSFSYMFPFKVSEKNVGIISTADVDGYDVVFSSLEGAPVSLIEPYYGELVEAYREVDGTVRLEEKVIYTRLEKNNDTYTVYIYKDPGQTKLIDTLTDQTEASLKKGPIDMTNYKDTGGTVIYHFGLYNTMLYFESSKIVSE